MNGHGQVNMKRDGAVVAFEVFAGGAITSPSI